MQCHRGYLRGGDAAPRAHALLRPNRPCPARPAPQPASVGPALPRVRQGIIHPGGAHRSSGHRFAIQAAQFGRQTLRPAKDPRVAGVPIIQLDSPVAPASRSAPGARIARPSTRIPPCLHHPILNHVPSTPCASSPRMRFRKRSQATPASRWEQPLWHTPYGCTTCGTILTIPTGPIGIDLFFLAVMGPCFSTPSSI